jgi:hypothetical protein
MKLYMYIMPSEAITTVYTYFMNCNHQSYQHYFLPNCIVLVTFYAYVLKFSFHLSYLIQKLQLKESRRIILLRTPSFLHFAFWPPTTG